MFIHRTKPTTWLIALVAGLFTTGLALAAGPFVPAVPVEKIEIIASSPEYPGGAHRATNILIRKAKGRKLAEYSSNGSGTETFLVFDFGRPITIAAMEHVDRSDWSTISSSTLTFANTPEVTDPIATVKVTHVNKPSGRTSLAFKPVTARYVRWQVTGLGPKGIPTVGGTFLRFFTPGTPEATPSRDTVEVATSRVVVERGGRRFQPTLVTVCHKYFDPVVAVLRVGEAEPRRVDLAFGPRQLEFDLPAVEKTTTMDVTLQLDDKAFARTEIPLAPVRPWELFILPHSHVDIGYTHVQTDVQRRQYEHFLTAMELTKKTADYPPGARFKWNAEVLWAVDSFLKHASDDEKKAMFEAVRKGTIGLDALYGNELTALCRPEELFRLTGRALQLAKKHDLTIDTAMISDVPGYTWGIVPALARSGVKFFSIGPNHCHRIGDTLRAWGDKPFHWVSPSGENRVLCWMDGMGYAWFLYEPGLNEEKFFKYLDRLVEADYPYDLVQVRYTLGGDNGPPDPKLPEFVKKWNAKYVYPKLTIATTREMFEEFDKRYGDRVVEVRGDFTPYWEDGAASSARETALAREASERLVQAEALWALLQPNDYPRDKFDQAWRDVLLYNEHTWGAHCSISKPDDDFTKSQWKIKQAFALDGEAQSRQLLDAAVGPRVAKDKSVAAVDVFNTSSWPRTDLVLLPAELSTVGDVVKTVDGRAVPSQRLSTGELAVLVADVPPLGARRLLLAAGKSASTGNAKAEGKTLDNGSMRLAVNEKTGAIASLRAKDIPNNLVDPDADVELNDYVYVAGRNPKSTRRVTAAKITVEENGPLVASLVVASDAPGCRKLTRTLRVVDGLARVDIANVLDKEDVRKKEAVHIGFGLNVPDGVMRLDVPWAVVRPETDQLVGACKNYLTAGRWVDVSGDRFGVTCATLDAPLVEVGKIRVDVPKPIGSAPWIENLEPFQTFYSYVMNNYWETNYKASQQGPTTFRYSLRPHGPYDAGAAKRFGIERSQPLVVVPVDPSTPARPSLFRIEPTDVIVSLLKPSEDGRAWIVRLFNTGEQPAEARLAWSDPKPARVTLSNPTEATGPAVADPIKLPPWGIVTLRASLPGGGE